MSLTFDESDNDQKPCHGRHVRTDGLKVSLSKTSQTFHLLT